MTDERERVVRELHAGLCQCNQMQRGGTLSDCCAWIAIRAAFDAGAASMQARIVPFLALVRAMVEYQGKAWRLRQDVPFEEEWLATARRRLAEFDNAHAPQAGSGEGT